MHGPTLNLKDHLSVEESAFLLWTELLIRRRTLQRPGKFSDYNEGLKSRKNVYFDCKLFNELVDRIKVEIPAYSSEWLDRLEQLGRSREMSSVNLRELRTIFSIIRPFAFRFTSLLRACRMCSVLGS
jgi:hypothetical protein